MIKLTVTLIVIGLLMSGCAMDSQPTLSPIVTKTEVYYPPENLFVCKGVKLPATFKDNKDVSVLIVEQNSALKKCKNNMTAIKNSLDNAAKEYN